MSESVDDGGSDSEAGEGAGTGHVGDFGEVVPGFAVFLELVVDEF